MTPNELRRFESKVTRTDSGCWIWVGARLRSGGYGAMRLDHDGATVRVHRVAYEHFVGSIPSGMCVCHRCDNPTCCNPQHLWLGTRGDNARDSVRKGRRHRPRQKLTVEIVRKMRAQRGDGATYASLARKYSISPTTALHACRGTTWRNA